MRTISVPEDYERLREVSSAEIEATQTYGAELQANSLVRPVGFTSFASHYSLRLVNGQGFST